MFLLNLLWMTGIALALVIAGLAYRQGSLKSKGIYGLGVITAVGLLVLAAVSCSEPLGWMQEQDVASIECRAASYGDVLRLNEGHPPSAVTGYILEFFEAEEHCSLPTVATWEDHQFESYAAYVACKEQAEGVYWQAFEELGYELTDPTEQEALDIHVRVNAKGYCYPEGGVEALPGAP